MKILQIVHLTCQVQPLCLEKSKKSFSTVLFIHTSDYLCYLKRKQTVIHLLTPAENVTTLTCELQNFFIRLKVCCVLSNSGGSEVAFSRFYRVTRRPAKGGHVLLFEVLSSFRRALALYGKMSGFSQSLTCPHCWLQWHNIISIVYTDF